MAAEARAGAPGAEATPQMELTPPTTAGGDAATATASGAMAEAPSTEPAVEEAAATAGAAAAAKVAGAPSTSPQPAQEDMPEVVYRGHLLLNPVEVPLPRLLVKTQRVMEEAEAGF
jgi:hypothetical protein